MKTYTLRIDEPCAVCEKPIRVFEDFCPARVGVRHARCEEDEVGE